MYVVLVPCYGQRALYSRLKFQKRGLRRAVVHVYASATRELRQLSYVTIIFEKCTSPTYVYFLKYYVGLYGITTANLSAPMKMGLCIVEPRVSVALRSRVTVIQLKRSARELDYK